MGKKLIIIDIIFIILIPLGFVVEYNKVPLRQKFFKTMAVTEFLEEVSFNDWSEKLHIDTEGNVVYKGMTIVKDYNRKPLKINNADYEEELMILKQAGYYKLRGND